MKELFHCTMVFSVPQASTKFHRKRFPSNVIWRVSLAQKVMPVIANLASRLSKRASSLRIMVLMQKIHII